MPLAASRGGKRVGRGRKAVPSVLRCPGPRLHQEPPPAPGRARGACAQLRGGGLLQKKGGGGGYQPLPCRSAYFLMLMLLSLYDFSIFPVRRLVSSLRSSISTQRKFTICCNWGSQPRKPGLASGPVRGMWTTQPPTSPTAERYLDRVSGPGSPPVPGTGCGTRGRSRLLSGVP